MMKIHNNPSKNAWKEIIRRPVFDAESIDKIVLPVLKDVRQRGDTAVREYTLKFDGVDVPATNVREEEFDEAIDSVSNELKNAIALAAGNIRTFHARQLNSDYSVETMPGVLCWRKSIAIEKVGLYIPGGTAPLFSTVLMLGIPAAIAGCKTILCTPPTKSGGIYPAILVAAREAGITTVHKTGGVQAIGAMAYGTNSIQSVNKIFGPGNQYVTAAKQQVSREGIAIDMPAGPSEVAIFADDSANPLFVVTDLLAQAEHGPDSQVLLVTTSESLAEQVLTVIKSRLELLPRKNIALQALKHSNVVILRDAAEAMDLLNDYAPEHLILACEDAEKLSEKVINAGSVFIGNYTPESAGDYASGTNHTLPTNGYAKALSGVGVQSFMKQVTFQKLTNEGVRRLGPSVEVMAAAEGLEGHKQSISVRLESLRELKIEN